MNGFSSKPSVMPSRGQGGKKFLTCPELGDAAEGHHAQVDGE